MKVYIGLDIGGTKMYGGLITERGDILRTKEVPSGVKRESNAQIIGRIKALIATLANGTTFHGIGIGLAGHIDHVHNKIAYASPNFLPNFKRLTLVPSLLKEFHVPVVLENDAKVFTLGEAVFGRGKGYRSVVGVTIGTGIGGGIVQDGAIIHGKNNLAGEVGHMFTRDPKKNWEALARGHAFNVHGNLNKEAVMLSDGLHNILNIIDPDIIIIGGGVAREPGLVTKARTEAHKRLHYKVLSKTPIVKSSLLRTAPILGAMLTVRGK
ncbi:MAG: ROK family protein [Candidatus Kerfeldbacteria bacterium]